MKEKNRKLGNEAGWCTPVTPAVEAEGKGWVLVGGQPGLHSKLQVRAIQDLEGKGRINKFDKFSSLPLHQPSNSL